MNAFRMRNDKTRAYKKTAPQTAIIPPGKDCGSRNRRKNETNLILSTLRRQSRLFAQFIGSDSIESLVPFDWHHPRVIRIDRMISPFALRESRLNYNTRGPIGRAVVSSETLIIIFLGNAVFLDSGPSLEYPFSRRGSSASLRTKNDLPGKRQFLSFPYGQQNARSGRVVRARLTIANKRPGHPTHQHVGHRAVLLAMARGSRAL